MKKTKWEKSRFIKRIRISEEVWIFINETKKKKCLSGRLDEIIKKYMLESSNK